MERIYNQTSFFYEVAQLLVITFFSIFFNSKRNKTQNNEDVVYKSILKRAWLILFTIVLFLPKYIDYSKLISSIDLRDSLCPKITSLNSLNLKGNEGKKLTYTEYQILKKSSPLTWIHKSAYEINYSYVLFDDFLGDYNFYLEYSIPLEIKIKPFQINNESGFTKEQSIKVFDNHKVVHYQEIKK